MWTEISKPTGTNYTDVNPAGKASFNDGGLFFDDSSVNFNATAIPWTNIPNPILPTIFVPGMTLGLLIPLTESRTTQTKDSWTRINKPT